MGQFGVGLRAMGAHVRRMERREKRKREPNRPVGVVPSPFMSDQTGRSGHPMGNPISDRRLFGSNRHHIDRYIFAAKATFVESHAATRRSEQCVILAQAHIHARINAGTALTDDDVARNDGFAPEFLNAKTTAGGIATIA